MVGPTLGFFRLSAGPALLLAHLSGILARLPSGRGCASTVWTSATHLRRRGYTPGVVSAAPLVEREEQLLRLQAAASSKTGSVVLLSGEAGSGKTSILSLLMDGLDHRYRVLSAACEPVGVPAGFAPLFEILDELPQSVRSDVRGGSGRTAVQAGVLEMLRSDRLVLILEDIHWADEATLGLVRYLGRRIASTMSCLIVTYRTEELSQRPLLALVVADLGPSAERIELLPLTLAAVEQLAQGVDVDPVRVHAVTLGNPFFVSEVIANPESVVPPSVGSAVQARVNLLSDLAKELLYMAAINRDAVPIDLAEELGPGALEQLDSAVQRGLLVATATHFSCRHDLIRESLHEIAPPTLKRTVHRRLLGFYEGREDHTSDIARLAYHARGAGEESAALRYSLRAAEDASASGAHRQSAFHFANALEYRELLDPESLGRVLLEAAKEHCLVNAFDQATEWASQRLELANGPDEMAAARAWLAYFISRENDLAPARREAEAALETLRQSTHSEELALAAYVLSWIELHEGRFGEAITLGDWSAEVASEIGSVGVEVHALAVAGRARVQAGDIGGLQLLDRAVRIGLDHESVEAASFALIYRASAHWELGRLDEARRLIEEAVDYTMERELDAWYVAAIAMLADLDVATGRWAGADVGLERVLGQRTCRQTEIQIMRASATLRLRRGDPGAAELVGQALTMADVYGGYDELVPACLLAAEAAWVGLVDTKRAAARYQTLSAHPALAGDRRGRSRLSFWARRLGLDQLAPATATNSQLEAAREVSRFESLGLPVEEAISRAMVTDPNLDRIFSSLSEMNADGVARGLRRELQRRGIKHVPRGERPTTREHPAGLTGRQVEVLGLISAGFSNAEIADRLFISEKTVSHHVSAILAKLNVGSRLQAAAVAHEKGWYPAVAAN
jgi:DNA-binding CsgD family transcriptional regulator/tetratricopeptide (TPR) repeat protein